MCGQCNCSEFQYGGKFFVNFSYSKTEDGDFSGGAVVKNLPGTSLVVQWLRILLPIQETQVRSLVWEDPTRRGATKPVRHNY